MASIKRSVPDAKVLWFNSEIEQNPEAPGFWEMWKRIYSDYGFQTGDYIVASELYGQRLAKELDGVFIPYDLNRSINKAKGTFARQNPIANWNDILPEFRGQFVQRVTVFGAESCGKTTLSRQLAALYDSPWLFEWARPYLEAVGPEITTEKMTTIWHGQEALQVSAEYLTDSPVIFQDTDLFSTVGYWDFWNMQTPPKLGFIADLLQSDLYLIVRSNIPFEPDPLRYGGDTREADDEYWIDLCERYKLNYVVLESSSQFERLTEASGHVERLLEKEINFWYERDYNE